MRQYFPLLAQYFPLLTQYFRLLSNASSITLDGQHLQLHSLVNYMNARGSSFPMVNFCDLMKKNIVFTGENWAHIVPRLGYFGL